MMNFTKFEDVVLPMIETVLYLYDSKLIEFKPLLVWIALLLGICIGLSVKILIRIIIGLCRMIITWMLFASIVFIIIRSFQFGLPFAEKIMDTSTCRLFLGYM
jgi:Na+/citrate or Na+/malate symporter